MALVYGVLVLEHVHRQKVRMHVVMYGSGKILDGERGSAPRLKTAPHNGVELGSPSMAILRTTQLSTQNPSEKLDHTNNSAYNQRLKANLTCQPIQNTSFMATPRLHDLLHNTRINKLIIRTAGPTPSVERPIGLVSPYGSPYHGAIASNPPPLPNTPCTVS